MDEQEQAETKMETKVKKSGMTTVTMVLVAVLIAIIFGGGAYAIVNNKAIKDKDNLNGQIGLLDAQVAYLKSPGGVPPLGLATATSSANATATADPTAGWKLFNEDYTKFQIKYPTSLSVIDWTKEIKSTTEAANANKDLIREIGFGQNSKLGDYIYAASVKQQTLATAKELVGYDLAGAQPLFSNVKVGGIDAIKATGKILVEDTGNGPATYRNGIVYLIDKQPYVYHLTLLSGGDEATFENFVSTFQFTK